jgi:hypothetical protein
MAKRSGIDGMAELERTFRELGKVPQTVATQAARAGGTIAYRAARANAPVDTGALKSGIIMKRERRTQPGKAVYDVEMDPSKTELYRRATKTGLRRKGGRGPDANTMIKGGYYYPASQEYGFLTVDGNYVPGYHFLKRAITENAPVIEKAVLGATAKAVDKALRKG